MATKIETLRKPNGDQVLPRTHAKAVSMENGLTVEVAFEDINEQLNGLATEIYVDEKVAQKSQVQIITLEEGD